MGYCISFTDTSGKNLDLIHDNGNDVLKHLQKLGYGNFNIRKQLYNKEIVYSEDVDDNINLPILTYFDFLEIAQDIMSNNKPIVNLQDAYDLKENVNLAIKFFEIADKLNDLNYFNDVIVDG